MNTAYIDTLTPDEVLAGVTGYSTRVLLRTGHPMVKALVRKTFPEYRGKRVQLKAWRAPQRLHAYWDGGTRSDWRIVVLATGKVGVPTDVVRNPFTAAAHEPFDLPAGSIAVEEVIFQGKHLGLTVWVRLDDVPALGGGSIA